MGRRAVTEHAVLAAGEALEVAAAAHFCCVSCAFCLLIAPLERRLASLPSCVQCSQRVDNRS